MTQFLFRKRIAFFLLLAAGVWVMLTVPPIIPPILLPAEPISSAPLFDFAGSPFYLTNTMVAMVIGDVILILLAIYLGRANRRMVNATDPTERAPKGLHNTLEALMEYLYGQAEETAGTKWVGMIFPIVMTIILMVVVANWMELVPTVDSVGILETSHTGEGYAPVQLTDQIGPIPPIYYLDRKNAQKIEVQHEQAVLAEAEGAPAEAGEEGACHEACVVVPIIRVLSTDLNFTLSLAIVAVVMTQVAGFRALGFGYLGKFFNFSTLFTNPLGLIDVVVGVLELIGEIARLLSFSFRLLGNIFAGSIMLFVISSLVPAFAPWLIAFLELFVGAIQAYVFGMLTLTFMSLATQSHGHDDEEHH